MEKIGELEYIMEDWKEIKLGDLATVKGGKRLPKGSNLTTQRNSHPYIRIRDLGKSKILQLNSEYEYVDDETQKTISRYITNKGDVLISIVGTIGLIGIVGDSLDNANLTEKCVKLVDLHGVDTDYLYYYLISEIGQNEITRGTVGAVQPKLPIKNIQDININLPPLPTQQKIAQILSSLDDKIELNNKINANLEQQAQALFKSWFVDFEPFGGEMPAGWKVGKLSEIAEITMGQSPDGKSYNEDGIGTVFYQGRAEFGSRFPTRRLFTTDPRRMAKKYDILMSVRAPVGDTNIANEDCCIGRGLAAIHSNDNHQSFVHYSVLSTSKQLEVFNGEGTVFGCINKDGLNNLEVVIPSKDDMNKFEKIVASLDADIYNRSEENRKLMTIRDTLLPKLMNGEIAL